MMPGTDSDLGLPSRERHPNVTMEDLRNDITRLTQIVRQLVESITELKEANRDRQTEKDRVTALYAGISILRWAMGLISTFVAGACVWAFNNVNEATNANRAHEIRLNNIEQTMHVDESRLQALERGQFADRIQR